MDNFKILVVVGPTATGKSEFAVKLAKRFGGEIISADSMQVYRQMDIATAKIEYEKRQGIKHHLIDVVDLKTKFSVADYVKKAEECLHEIVNRNKIPVVVGGTGLYIDGLVNGFSFKENEVNETIRKTLLSELNEFGPVYLFEKLKKIDFNYCNKLHPNNERRIIRALELFYSTGITMSEREKLSKLNSKKFDYLKIGLNFLNRQNLYERINERVNLMMEKGLLLEAKKILNSKKELNSTALQAIGYKEFLPYFSGEVSLQSVVEKLKQNTRKLAKRQLTWFKKDGEINWFFLDEFQEREILDKVFELVGNFFGI